MGGKVTYYPSAAAATNHLVQPAAPRGRCCGARTVRCVAETNMAKTALGMSKRTLVQALSASAALFGVTGVLAPRALGSTYGVPPSPHTTQLLRLFGSRMLALAAWTFTAESKEETDRVLAVSAGMNIVDTLAALAAARGTGATGVRAAITSATFAALGLTIRSLED